LGEVADQVDMPSIALRIKVLNPVPRCAVEMVRDKVSRKGGGVRL
jgi:hypothetical protein